MTRSSDFQNIHPAIDRTMPGAFKHDYYYHGAQLIDLGLSKRQVRKVKKALWTIHRYVPQEQVDLALGWKQRRLTLSTSQGLSVPKGLLPVVERLLGISLAVDAQLGDLPLNEFANFAGGSGGVIGLHGGARASDFTRWIAAENPVKRVALLVGSVKTAEQLGAELRSKAGREVVARATHPTNGRTPKQITVATRGGLQSAEARFSNCDILIFADVRDALSHQGARPIVHAHQRLFAFQTAGTRLSELEFDRKNVLFGFKEYAAYGTCRTLRRVTADCIALEDKIGIGKHGEPDAQYFRRAIWANQQRNALIRKVIKAVLRRRPERFDLGRVLAQIPNECPPMVAVLVESVPHWRELNLETHFCGWGVTGNSQMRARPANNRFGHLWILTQEDLLHFDRLPFDVIIRADGGGAGLDIPSRLLVAGSEDNYPLHIIDIKDRFHLLANQLSQSRRASYRKKGWFSARLTQAEGAAEFFLRRTPRSLPG